ncbi:MAG: purine permease [Spirochaetia bacterium]|nr:purine permease [Spirochaetia bacterium]MCI7435196.1 purine permease [Spirochaetia bacterium]
MKDANAENIFQLDGKVPLGKAIPIGLQHILAMFVANITPMMILASVCGLDQTITAKLIQNAMIVAGLGTLIQLCPVWKLGSKLPVVMGISFTFLNSAIFVGTTYGYATIIGCVLIGGIIEGILGLFAKYWIKLISPIVAATVVTAIGFSLLTVGANSFAGGQGAENYGVWQNWVIGSVTLLCCICFQIFTKGYLKVISVLFGLVVGYILSICLGVVDFSALQNTKVVSVPAFLPFKPEFNIGAILSFVVIYLVSATETIGDTTALASSALDRNVTDKELAGSIACDGFVSSIGGLFGCTPITSFSQNVGLVAMTKVVNRFTIGTGAIILIVAGIFPVFGALLTTVPQAVLGGCTIMMFGTIVVAGFQMLGKCGYTQRNTTIAALSLSVGLGFTQCSDMFKIFPQIVQSVFAQNCVSVVFVLSVILNLVLPKDKDEE